MWGPHGQSGKNYNETQLAVMPLCFIRLYLRLLIYIIQAHAISVIKHKDLSSDINTQKVNVIFGDNRNYPLCNGLDF